MHAQNLLEITMFDPKIRNLALRQRKIVLEIHKKVIDPGFEPGTLPLGLEYPNHWAILAIRPRGGKSRRFKRGFPRAATP